MLAAALGRRQALAKAVLRSTLRSSKGIRRTFASWPDHEILPMPALSPTMEAGNLGAWNLKVGDPVIPGNAVAEIETDKASVAFEAQDDGFIAALLHEEGAQDIAVGTPIAVVVTEEEDVAAFAEFTLKDALGDQPAAEPVAEAAPAPAAPVASTPAPTPTKVETASVNVAAPVAPAQPQATAVVDDDLDGQPSWRSKVLETSPLAQAMLAQQLAYEEQFGFTAMEPLRREVVSDESQ